MEFRGIIPFSLIEYPGKFAAVVYTGGCNFRCPFCQNRDLVLNPNSLPVIPENQVLELLENRKDWIEALAITGGEPTLHPGLPEFVESVKDMGFLVELETNGSNPGMLRGLVDQKIVDYVAMDVKAPLVWEKYKVVAGIEDRGLFERVLKSVELLKYSAVDYEFRTTVVPEVLELGDILEIADQLRGARKYVIQQFVPHTTVDEKFEQVKQWSPEQLKNIEKQIKNFFDEFKIRGI